jgi:hypothetical protein
MCKGVIGAVKASEVSAVLRFSSQQRISLKQASQKVTARVWVRYGTHGLGLGAIM